MALPQAPSCSLQLSPAPFPNPSRSPSHVPAGGAYSDGQLAQRLQDEEQAAAAEEEEGGRRRKGRQAKKMSVKCAGPVSLRCGDCFAEALRCDGLRAACRHSAQPWAMRRCPALRGQKMQLGMASWPAQLEFQDACCPILACFVDPPTPAQGPAGAEAAAGGCHGGGAAGSYSRGGADGAGAGGQPLVAAGQPTD